MTNEGKWQASGEPIIFADHATDFVSNVPTTAANSVIPEAASTPVAVQIDLTSLPASGSSQRNSTKTASLLLSSQLPYYYSLSACLEFVAAPTAGGLVDFYWAPSAKATAANGNPAGITGTDASITLSSGDKGQLILIGSLIVRNNVINKVTDFGMLVPRSPYGCLVVDNKADQALAGAGAMDETHIVLQGYVTAPGA